MKALFREPYEFWSGNSKRCGFGIFGQQVGVKHARVIGRERDKIPFLINSGNGWSLSAASGFPVCLPMRRCTDCSSDKFREPPGAWRANSLTPNRASRQFRVRFVLLPAIQSLPDGLRSADFARMADNV